MNGSTQNSDRRIACVSLAAAFFLIFCAHLPAQEDGLGANCLASSRSNRRPALKSFRIHPGFRLEPVAVEPMVTDPVSVCYDADGRLYVVEMRGYPYPEKAPSGKVTCL